MLNTSSNIQHLFDKGAQDYDAHRRQLIPCFDDYYGTALELIPFEAGQHFRVLDLGAGTGLIAAFIAEMFPHAEITLADFSQDMLNKARERFNEHPRISYLEIDYTQEPLGGPFEVIISGLSIHHLTDADKQTLFGKIFESLTPEGIFINADSVRGETAAVTDQYWAAWHRQIREKGASEEAINAALERMKEDKMSTLNEQLGWLKDVGFEQVNCWYKFYWYVVYSGRKP